MRSSLPFCPTACPPVARRGFTLVEVTIAMTILALVLSSSLTVLSMGFRAMDTARAVRVATQILQDEAENVRLAQWATVQGWTTVEQGAVDGASLTPDAVYGTRFRCNRKVNEVTGKATMRRITLTINWTGSDGKAHTRNTQTYYTNQGLFSYVSN